MRLIIVPKFFSHILSSVLFVCLFVCVLHKIGRILTVLWSLSTAEVMEIVLVHYTPGKREP